HTVTATQPCTLPTYQPPKIERERSNPQRTARDHPVDVIHEIVIGAREPIQGDAEQLTEDLGLLEEVVPLTRRQRPDESVVSDQRGIDQRRVDPQQEVRV